MKGVLMTKMVQEQNLTNLTPENNSVSQAKLKDRFLRFHCSGLFR